MIPDLLIVALDYFREPRRFPQFSNPKIPLPAGITELLSARSHALSEEKIGETARLLNASEYQCREALLFFVKQVMLEAGGDHYRTLGLPRAAKNALVKQHYHYLIRLFHPDREATGAQWDDVYAARINEAYGVLRDPRKRHEYDSTLPAQDGFGPRPGLGFPPAPAPVQPESRRPDSRRVVTPAAGKAALLLFGVIAAVVAILLFNQTGQPRLRIQLTDNGELQRPLVPPEKPGTRSDLSWESGEIQLDTTDELIGNTHSGNTNGEITDAEATGRGVPQSIEDIVRERVAEATFAVLGPPRKSQAQKPENGGSLPVTKQETFVRMNAEDPREPKTVDAKEVHEYAVVTSAAGPAAKPSSPTALVLTDTLPRSIPSSEAEAQSDIMVSGGPVAAPESEELDARRFDLPAAPEAISGNRADTLPSVVLAEILKALAENYELGDAEAFARLFSADARTTDASGKDAILRLYSQFFALPERRDMTIRQFTWDFDDPDIHVGHGVAYIVTRPFNGGEPAQGELLLRLKVQQQPDGFRITEMDYRYR